MQNINCTLNESMTAISILLVFITILFDIKYPKINNFLKKPIKEGTKAKAAQKKAFINLLVIHWLPVIILHFLCGYIMTPLCIKTIKQSSFNLINFDFTRTAFILIWVLVLLFFIASIKIGINIFNKIKLCNQ